MTQPPQAAVPGPGPRVARRNVAKTAAWVTPTILATAAAPAYAVSMPCTAVVTTPGLANGVTDLYLRDTKATNSNTNTSPSTTTVVNLTLRIDCGGVSTAGVSVTVAGDTTTDGEGNYMIGFSPATQTSGFGESPVQKVFTGTTDTNGEVKVKVSTATYSATGGAVDCGFVPRSGTWTVQVEGQYTTTFTYTVYDGTPNILC